MSRRRGRERRRRGNVDPTPAAGSDPALKLRAIHLLMIGGGVIVAVAGFWLLSGGSISAAPALLILAYLVLIPIGLVLPDRKRDSSEISSDR